MVGENLIDDPSVFLSESERKMDEELGKSFYEDFLKWEAQQEEGDNISLFANVEGKNEKKIGLKHVPYQYSKLNGHVCNNCEWFTSVENNEVVHRCNILDKQISWPFDYTCDKGMFGMDRVHYHLSKLNEE